MKMGWTICEEDQRLELQATIVGGGYNRRTHSGNTTIDHLIPGEAYRIEAVFVGSGYTCKPSVPVTFVTDLAEPFQQPPSDAMVGNLAQLLKSVTRANILLFGAIGSGKSSLNNALLTLFDPNGVSMNQLSKLGASGDRTTTKELCKESVLQGSGVFICDSCGWAEEGVPKTLVGDYNATFLNELITGHFQPGCNLEPPFEKSEFYIARPGPDAKFDVVVLTFSCENIGYNPYSQTNPVSCQAEQSLLHIYKNLLKCRDVQAQNIRIILALTKADYLLCTLDDLHRDRRSQIRHINATSTTDIRAIFHKRVARDVKEYFVKKGFAANQIVFTCGYTHDQTHRRDFDALNALALNVMIHAAGSKNNRR
eukprot:c10038_g1_i1.p1 GENE.c10038_g1_i1~~c10038_g1_i1.p1  ORF type:complete len:393 (+),score=63.94 c10038_g1_i1:80-1180(+)